VLTTVELGVVGLGALLFFFYCHARVSARLPDPASRILAHGLLALMVVGCLFNSFLLDHNEGVFFCWLTGLLCAGAQPWSVRQGGSTRPC
jgi:O-antigen ligase